METYDVIVLGTGPAGLQAAIHAARKKVSVLVLGKASRSSLYNAHIENFCCMIKISGEEILRIGRQQATGFGADFLEADVLRISPSENGFVLDLESGIQLGCKALILATGTQRNRLGVPGEKDFLGKGVSYCVDCDGYFYKGQTVAVVGGQSAAVDGALTLTRIAGKVYLVCETLAVSPQLEEKLSRSTVEIHSGANIKAIGGDTEVKTITLRNGTELKVDGVFIEQGAKGLMELATALGIQLDDEMRFIQTDKQQATNIEGIFAAGDVCGPPWQMAKAVGEGCVAGVNAADYAKKQSS